MVVKISLMYLAKQYVTIYISAILCFVCVKFVLINKYTYINIFIIFKQILSNFLGKQASQYSFHNIHVNQPWVLQVASHANILKPVKEILGPNVILLDSRFICKYPDDDVRSVGADQAFVAWHQDMR